MCKSRPFTVAHTARYHFSQGTSPGSMRILWVRASYVLFLSMWSSSAVNSSGARQGHRAVSRKDGPRLRIGSSPFPYREWNGAKPSFSLNDRWLSKIALLVNSGCRRF